MNTPLQCRVLCWDCGAREMGEGQAVILLSTNWREYPNVPLVAPEAAFAEEREHRDRFPDHHVTIEMAADVTFYTVNFRRIWEKEDARRLVEEGIGRDYSLPGRSR